MRRDCNGLATQTPIRTHRQAAHQTKYGRKLPFSVTRSLPEANSHWHGPGSFRLSRKCQIQYTCSLGASCKKGYCGVKRPRGKIPGPIHSSPYYNQTGRLRLHSLCVGHRGHAFACIHSHHRPWASEMLHRRVLSAGRDNHRGKSGSGFFISRRVFLPVEPGLCQRLYHLQGNIGPTTALEDRQVLVIFN